MGVGVPPSLKASAGEVGVGIEMVMMWGVGAGNRILLKITENCKRFVMINKPIVITHIRWFCMRFLLIE